MNNISLIAAIGENNELGYNNELIWKLPNDLKFFRKITLGKNIVMGSNTFYSLKKILPGRKHIVLTSKNIDNKDILVINNKEDLLEYLKQIKEEVMIIGGASVYKQLLKYANNLYITHINDSYDKADTFFPQINYNEWESELLGIGNDNNIEYKHILYKRKVSR